MAKYKQRRRKPRASVTLRFKKQERIHLPQCSSILPSKLPVSTLNQSRPFPSWALTLSNITKAVRPLVTTLLRWYCWCQSSVIQFLQFFRVIKNTAFQSHVPLEELNALRERLEKLETEFAALQSTIQKGTVVALEKTSCQTAKDDQCQHSSQVPLRPVESSSLHSEALMPPAPHLLPPPPPPPLPPPPVPRCLSKTEGTKKQDALSKTDVPRQITLKDLLSVKLKKTQSCLKIEKGSPLQKRRALITISDLQSINLKSKVAAPPNGSANGSSTPGRSCLDFRKHLRRVSIQRSPGGTPLTHKENLETGTGLTPLMTQALRRKFQLAHPKSPSPSHLPRGSSFGEQS
ncbi:LOW QUALITY PROTEIN: proline-rich protein 11 [Heteronotia binoei]|uniref:LOW QUALITY PROTEIN: proline-rich protein 11 n=1 Tax=Heteronotia binoei TaxID=13085 RepID=UPI0029313FD1|nr:LOW QUALITY PROTEIN: proline-rich protein 11 [Heteronotia binoei]